jgi:hypothetical protein
LDFERNAALLLRDNGFVSSELLRKAAGLFTNTATSTAHMSSGLSLLEALVHRGIKSKGPGDTTGILIDDIEVRVGAICNLIDLFEFHAFFALDLTILRICLA